MLKRIAVVFTVVAALAVAAPVAPAGSGAGTEIGSGDLAWGAYFAQANRPFLNYSWDVTSTVFCVLTPFAIGLTGPGGVVFGLACGLSGVA